MSSLSNPSGGGTAAASAYIRSLLELLGERDPIETQRNLIPALRAAIAGLDDAALRRPERAGKWSIVEVIQHLADTELVTGFRIRMILAHPRPEIPSYDQDLWARGLFYSRVRLADALDQLRALREANLRILETLDDEALDRDGIHAERGPESVRRLARMIGGHDLAHLAQIQRIRTAISSSD